jgi:hypothetical protein
MFKIASFFIVFLSVMTLSSCNEEKKKSVPDGFEIVSSDDNFYFVLVDKEYWGDRYTQKYVGNAICKNANLENNYCEVYYFASKEDIPEEFPIINREKAMGVFKKNYDESDKLKYLPKPEPKPDDEIFVFFKSLYREVIGQKRE